VLISVGIY